jgi:hypothetical protein
MKHQHPAPAAVHPIHAAPKVRALPGRTTKSRGPGLVESGDGRDQAIREVAYSFYEARGRIAGHELDDWLQAEAQVARGTLAAGIESFAQDSTEP